eukprot:GHVU01037493.1.p1 GENE.GHVU01037493.1~~GHVU01037493.1.p1  ORF type:complete len:176 (-),score=12.41 GHVU01037493.1:160-687(-)
MNTYNSPKMWSLRTAKELRLDESPMPLQAAEDLDGGNAAHVNPVVDFVPSLALQRALHSAHRERLQDLHAPGWRSANTRPHANGLTPVQRTRRASRLGGQQSHRHACVCGGRRPDQPGRRSVAVQTVRVMPPGEKVPAQRPTLCFTAGQLDRSCVPTPPVDSSCYTPECSDDGTE